MDEADEQDEEPNNPTLLQAKKIWFATQNYVFRFWSVVNHNL